MSDEVAPLPAVGRNDDGFLGGIARRSRAWFSSKKIVIASEVEQT